MSDSGPCWVAEGGGCHQDVPPSQCDTADTADTAEEDVGQAVVEGGGSCGCASASPGGLWMVVLAVLLSRRWCLLLLLLLPGAAGAVDAQHLQTADGGTFLALMEITRSTPWSVRAAISASHTRQAVVLRSGLVEEVILDDLQTLEAGVSLAAGEWFRLGVGTPLHASYTLLGIPEGPTRGDMALWMTVHMSDTDADVQRGWTVALDVPVSDAAADFLGDPGGVRGRLTSTRDLAPLTLGVDLGMRLQQATELPGVTWGSRWEGGVGVDWAASDRYGLTGELLASAPLNLDGVRAGWPVELLVSGRRRLSRNTTIRIGGGVGLTAGIGSPSWRLTAMLQSDELSGADRDGDGLPNLRDACASRPEDIDGYRDGDGCPDPDNDHDTFLDVVDACPMEAEVFNGHEDHDGCPDAVATLSVTVRSSAPALLEKVDLSVNDVHRETLPGEPTDFRIVPGGRVVLEAHAAGHQPLLEEMPLPHGGLWAVNLTMDPIQYGPVHIVVTDTDGAPIEAQTVDGAPIPLEGATLEYPTGQAEIEVVSTGYLPGSATVFVSATTTTEAVIPLQSAGIWMEGSQLRVGQIIPFELDSADLSEDSTAALEALAVWLSDHPEVLLLRVEGLADALGSPAYNHRLSIRRAQTVQQWLIDAGIHPDRLEAIGSGEALAQGADSDRSVQFLVVVWADDPSFSDAQRALP